MTHIFVSYQHQYKETVVALRDALQSYGYKTWIDKDDMVGDMLNGMAEAVEGAAVVIICMSSSYMKSKDCKMEAEYAKSKDKPIIPIRVEPGFKPDGWLGLIFAYKMIIDFNDLETFDVKFDQLIKELAAKGVEPTAVDFEEDRDESDQEGEGQEDEEDGGSGGDANNEDGEGHQDNSEDNEIRDKSYTDYLCCACSKKKAAISPDDNYGQY